MRFLHILIAAWLVAGVAAPARAQAPDPRAAQLFEEGRAFARNGKNAEACARFAASFELDRAIGTKLNLGDCQEKLGHFREAWRWFDEAAREFEQQGDKRAKFARERADALEAQLGTVVVKLSNPTLAGLVVSIGGRNVAVAAEIREAVDPGEIEVRVSAPGRTTFVRSETVAAGGTMSVEPTLDAPTTPSLPKKPISTTTPPPPEQESPRNTTKLVAYGFGAAGAAGLVTTSVLVLVSRSRYNGAISSGHCVDTATQLVCDDTGLERTQSAISLANAATWTGMASVVFIAAGAVLYFTAPKDHVVVTPTAGSDAAGVAIFGRF